MMNKIYIILILLANAFSSDQRVNALGNKLAFWDDDIDYVSLFPQLYENLEDNVFQVSKIGVGYNPSVKYYFGGNNSDYKKGILLQNNASSFGFYIASGGFGAQVSFDIDYSKVDSTLAVSSETTSGVKDSPNMFFDSVIGIKFSDNFNSSLQFSTTFKNHSANINLLLGENHFVNSNVFSSPDSSSYGVNYSYFKKYSATAFNSRFNVTSLVSIGGELFWADVINGQNINYSKTTYTELGFNIPITVSLEAKVIDWLIFRTGLIKSLSFSNIQGEFINEDNEINNTINNAIYIGGSDLIATYGVGFSYNNFMIDVLINESVFLNPIQQLTGFEKLGTSATATITYTW